jgi:hypothetical protein
MKDQKTLGTVMVGAGDHIKVIYFHPGDTLHSMPLGGDAWEFHSTIETAVEAMRAVRLVHDSHPKPTDRNGNPILLNPSTRYRIERDGAPIYSHEIMSDPRHNPAPRPLVGGMPIGRPLRSR